MRGGIRFFERAHIKDALAYARITENITDELAWHRVLQLYEGIGDVTAQKIVAQAREVDSWEKIFDLPMGLGAAASKGWSDFVKAMRQVYSARSSATELMHAIAKVYREYATLSFTDFKDRLHDIYQLPLFY